MILDRSNTKDYLMKWMISKIMKAAIIIHLLILIFFAVSFFEVSKIFNSDSIDDINVEFIFSQEVFVS